MDRKSTLGIICEINENDCVQGACHNGGTCIDRVGGFECSCPPGFVGPRCEGDINECLSNPCSSYGTQDCVQLVNNYHCNCKPGYMGRHCESKVNFCDSSPCQNGGMCNGQDVGHLCTCPDGFYGKNCEFKGFDCDSNPCQNGGVCTLIDGGGYRCECPSGTRGTHCELDSWNECSSMPCEHNGPNWRLCVHMSTKVGSILRTNVRVKKDSQGKDMIYPWRLGSEGLLTLDGHRNEVSKSFTYHSGTSGVVVYLELDNFKCTLAEGKECFPSANEAANYLAGIAARWQP
ncbi:uncharacterized protein GBIM_06139 [Gryllus bimaculatus]|nr:uncharacterized protein GBIM_06139 [Gryllus bimaculatus]